jgi:hypothetical protein
VLHRIIETMTKDEACSHLCFKRISFFRLVVIAASKQMTIAVTRHPFCTRKMTFESAQRAIRLSDGIDVENQASHFTPISVISVCVEEAEVSNKVLLVIRREHRISRRQICDIGIERW